MSFKSQLAALRGKVARELPTGLFDRLQVEAADLRVSGRWRTALKAGQAAPDLQLPAGTGAVIHLNHLLEAGPVVACFYRGDWCRFCRLQLQALADIADDVRAWCLVDRDRAANSRGASGLRCDSTVSALADVDAKVCKSFGLTFLPPDDLGDAYRALGRPVGDEHLTLPVPAIHVIDRSSMIVFSYLDTDFTSRLDPCCAASE
jgi:peroxiredoxin